MEQNQTITRDGFWDIVKGLGIIAIILGHSCGNPVVISFVYLFHLPVFFFVTGALYNRAKWSGNLHTYVGSRIASVWPRYLLYGILFILLHNPFVSAGALNAPLYNHTEMLGNYLNYALFVTDSPLAGAMWFIPVWLFATCLFGVIVSVCDRFFDNEAEKGKCRSEIAIGLVCLLCSVLGIILNQRNVNLYFHTQTSFLAIGFMYLGYALRNFGKGECHRYFRWWLIPLCGAALWFINQKLGYVMDLSCNNCQGAMIYLTGAIGILMLLCMAELLQKIRFVDRVLAFFGRHSFDIMALHFIILKLVDMVWDKIAGGNPEALIAFPCGYPKQMWAVYLILGLVIPSLAGVGMDRIIDRIRTGKRT